MSRVSYEKHLQAVCFIYGGSDLSVYIIRYLFL